MGKFSQDKKSIVLIKSVVSFLSLKRYCPFLRNGFTSLKVAESLLGSTFLTTLELSQFTKRKISQVFISLPIPLEIYLELVLENVL